MENNMLIALATTPVQATLATLDTGGRRSGLEMHFANRV
jgi:hypothetical protein